MIQILTKLCKHTNKTNTRSTYVYSLKQKRRLSQTLFLSRDIFLSRIEIDRGQAGQLVNLSTYLDARGPSQSDASIDEAIEISAKTFILVAVSVWRGRRRGGRLCRAEYARSTAYQAVQERLRKICSLVRRELQKHQGDYVITAVTSENGLARFVSSLVSVFQPKADEWICLVGWLIEFVVCVLPLIC